MLTRIKKEPILVFAVVMCIITCFFVPPNLSYFKYINYKSLVCLFCMMLSVEGLVSTKIFKILAVKILNNIRNSRTLLLTLVFFPTFLSIFITNDVAVLTFVPFAIIVLTMCDMGNLVMKAVILITIGCNLGGLLSPMGNSQNLYLFSYYNLESFYLLKHAFPTYLAGFALLFILCITTKCQKLKPFDNKSKKLKKRKLILYFILLVLSFTSFLVKLSYYYWIVLGVVVFAVLLSDKSIYKKINYKLLIVFVAFFIFAGNIRNIESISLAIQKLINGKEFFLAIGISQIISNTPTAILLSQFSQEVLPLLLGVNIGKNGTLIASLTGLFALNMFTGYENKPGKFILKFMMYGFLFVLILGTVGYLNILFITT